MSGPPYDRWSSCPRTGRGAAAACRAALATDLGSLVDVVLQLAERQCGHRGDRIFLRLPVSLKVDLYEGPAAPDAVIAALAGKPALIAGVPQDPGNSLDTDPGGTIAFIRTASIWASLPASMSTHLILRHRWPRLGNVEARSPDRHGSAGLSRGGGRLACGASSLEIGRHRADAFLLAAQIWSF